MSGRPIYRSSGGCQTRYYRGERGRSLAWRGGVLPIREERWERKNQDQLDEPTRVLFGSPAGDPNAEIRSDVLGAYELADPPRVPVRGP